MIENANVASAAPKKEYNNLYTGIAEVVEVGFFEARFTQGLTDEEIANAMDIHVKVRTDDASVGEQTIELPLSARVGKFGKTDSEMTIDALSKQGLVENGDPSTIYNAVGKKCNVDVYQETSNGRTYTRCRLSRAQKKISGDEMARRLAAFGKSKAAPAPAAPAPAPKVNANPF